MLTYTSVKACITVLRIMDDSYHSIQSVRISIQFVSIQSVSSQYSLQSSLCYGFAMFDGAL
jgi:hypothetical protein